MAKKIDEFTANCTLCNKNFTIKYEGYLKIKKHLETNEHKTNSKAKAKQNAINNFFLSKKTQMKKTKLFQQKSLLFIIA